jgi:hypothetical protein
MNADAIVTKLEPWLAQHRQAAWKPIVEASDGTAAVSKFGGVPWLEPETPWPECLHCKMPLPLFLQLDLSDLPRELDNRFGTGLLQLFYCTRDECQGNGGWDPFGDEISRVRILQPRHGNQIPSGVRKEGHFPEKRIVGWSRLTDLPSPCEHDELGLIYTYDFNAGTLRLQCPELDFDVVYPMNDCPAESIALSEWADKLAGWPAWVQGVEYPNCPQCGRRMVHVFQVDSEDNLPFMFGDVGCGHITQCPEHKEIVAFGWACC